MERNCVKILLDYPNQSNLQPTESKANITETKSMVDENIKQYSRVIDHSIAHKNVIAKNIFQHLTIQQKKGNPHQPFSCGVY